MKKKLCVYHGNCADGFTGAWVLRKAFQEEGQDVEFFPGFYGKNDLPDVEGKDVILVDFTYPRATLEKLIEKASTTLILDHHKTAQADLEGLNGALAVFDMNRAGCRIAWDFFNPGKEPPTLLKHIEDRDLLRFALRGTREIQAAVFSFEYKFDVWDWLMVLDGNNLRELELQGEAIERKHFKDIRELLGVVTRTMKIGGYDVPVANLPYTLVSDAANILAKDQPFAACYWDTPEKRIFGLRSLENGLDVSEIAKQYGGGGHKHVSGFSVPYDHELTRAP